MDCVVKYVLEGHTRGVNWANFHPTLPLIISCGDDRLIKIWRMNETRAWEVDTCRGHYNNVGAALFHPKQDVIVSVAEDKTIRVWDLSKRTSLSTFRRENDRFWCLAVHPEMNLFVAGHDSGIVVFKLERERPAFDVHNDIVYYVKEKSIHAFNLNNANDIALITIKRGHPGQAPPPKTLSYNPAEHAVMLATGKDDAGFQIYPLPKDNTTQVGREVEPKRGQASNALYVARNRFVTLENGKIYVKDLNNNPTKEIEPASSTGKHVGKITDVFLAGGKTILVVSASIVMLYDLETRSSLHELSCQGTRYVSWSSDQSKIAILSKHNIIIASKTLEQICTVHETIKIKSGAWDSLGVFVYTTLNHIKYCLTNGDNGIIKTIEQPMYIIRVKNNLIHCLDRLGRMQVIAFDPTEYKFKLALINRNYDQVFHLIKTSNLMGQSIIGYLQQKGYPEIALQFVKDPKTRFDLAIECGNIEAALEMAKQIDKETYWTKLGSEALRQGNQLVLEFVYQKTKQFEKLSFLYLAVGNRDKLEKMLKIAEARGDMMSRYQNSLYLGDVSSQVKILRETGQIQLAYLVAKTHGLDEIASEILEEAGLPEGPPVLPNAVLLRGRHPAFRQPNENWPLLQVSKNVFEMSNSAPSVLAPAEESVDEVAGDWGDDLELEETKSKPTKPVVIEEESVLEDIEGGEGWDLDADLELSSVDAVSMPSPVKPTPAQFVPPKPGHASSSQWIKSSQVAADHVAAGAFESAMKVFIIDVVIETTNWSSQFCSFETILYGHSAIFSILSFWNCFSSTYCKSYFAKLGKRT